MTSDARPGSRILASLGSADGKGVVRVEDRYDTDIDDLWAAITDPSRLARWFGQVQGDLRPGGAFNLSVEWDGTGRVEVCEPPLRLRVTIRESDESYRSGNGVPPFDSMIEVSLTPQGRQTDLIVEVRGMPLDKIAFYGAGWQIHAEHLAAHIAAEDLGDTEARWDELVPPYQVLAAAVSHPEGASDEDR
jgi:uncharacterized protein YndB with AHSA1/START domain